MNRPPSVAGLLRWRWPLVIVAVLFAAARRGSAATPVIWELLDGYGIVAVDVTATTPGRTKATTTPASHPSTAPTVVDVTCRVQAVWAQPVGHPPLPLQAGDVIQVRLTVGGDDGQIAWNPVIQSDAVLALRPALGGSYEQNPTGNSVRPVDLSADDRRLYAALRDMAALPPLDRADLWAATAADPTIDSFMRLDLLDATGHLPADTPPAVRAAVHDRLLAGWRNPAAMTSVSIAAAYELALLPSPSFEASDDRTRVWLDVLFAPTAANRRDDPYRDHIANTLFPDLAVSHPNAVGDRLVRSLADPAWPAPFRWEQAQGLLQIEVSAPHPNPAWDGVVQSYFAEQLALREPAVDQATAHLIRWAVARMSPAAVRSLTVGGPLRAAFTKSAAEMRARATRPGGDREAAAAADEIDRLLKVAG